MWYVIQVLSGQEDKACELINLHAAGQRSKDNRPVLKECFVPRYQVERKFHGQYRTLTRNLFPGYVIAVTNRVDELNDRLVKIPTFTRMLGSEKSFIPLDRSERRSSTPSQPRSTAPSACRRRIRRRQGGGNRRPHDQPRRLDHRGQPPQRNRPRRSEHVRQNHQRRDRTGDCRPQARERIATSLSFPQRGGGVDPSVSSVASQLVDPNGVAVSCKRHKACQRAVA